MKDNHSIKGFLIRHFITILICVGLAELLITYGVNKLIIGIIQEYYTEGSSSRITLTSSQTIILSVSVFAESIVILMKSKIPIIPDGTIEGLLATIDNFTKRSIPVIPKNWHISDMGRDDILVVLLCMTITLMLLLAPYITAAIIFSHIVSAQVEKLQIEKENIYKENDKQRNLMLSDIAHDLRTPITTISGYSKALSDGMVKDENKQKEYLQAIMNKSARMADLINILFEYVKLDSFGFELDKEELDLCELLRENAAMIYSDIEDAGMEFEIDIPEDKEVIVYADKLQISRVVTNLLVNAIRHAGQGGKILLELNVRYEGIWVMVADAGEMIPEEMIPHLFQPFAKGDKSRHSGGTGLGLSIAKKVMEKHGFSIFIQQPYRDYSKAFTLEFYEYKKEA